jgi:bifunctional non-homologous end joining protein LigD
MGLTNANETRPGKARRRAQEQPDQVIFDLDPDEALPFSRVAAAARRVRALRAERGLESFVKTAGGKGLHVCVPLAPEHGWEALEEFSRAVALRLARDEPSAFTATMAKAQRKDELDRLSGATDLAIAEVPIGGDHRGLTGTQMSTTCLPSVAAFRSIG